MNHPGKTHLDLCHKYISQLMIGVLTNDALQKGLSNVYSLLNYINKNVLRFEILIYILLCVGVCTV